MCYICISKLLLTKKFRPLNAKPMKASAPCLFLTFAATVLFGFSSIALIRHVPGQYSTIQAAIDAAQDGDTLLVAPGTYSPVIISDKQLTLASLFLVTGDESYINNTIINANGGLSSVIKITNNTKTVTVTGFKITGGKGTSVSGITRGGGIHCTGPAVISHNYIMNNGGVITDNHAFGAGIFHTVGSLQVLHNYIFANGYVLNSSDGAGGEGGGIYSENYVQIIGNEIIENYIEATASDEHNYTSAAAEGGGIRISSGLANDNIICNNRVSANAMSWENYSDAWAGGGGFYIGTGNANNNLIANNQSWASAVWNWSSSTAAGYIGGTISNSTITGNYDDNWPALNATSGNNNIIYNNSGYEGNFTYTWFEDPYFTNGPQGNYYLSQLAAGQSQQSPCVDAGDPSSPMISGTTRTDEVQDLGIVDMGFHYPAGMLILSLTTMLQGPFNGVNMNCNLSGNNLLPLVQPFNSAPWFYFGDESIASVPANVTDWVLVEVRQTPGQVVARKAAFITANGKITGLDGNESQPLVFNGFAFSDNLYVVIRHRNHLAVMSSQPLLLSNQVCSYNFTLSSSQVYGGTLGCRELAPGTWGMVSGDGNGDGMVNNQDKINVWQQQTPGSGYLGGDFNMDGQVNNVDKIVHWSPNGGRSSQVPVLPGLPQLVETLEVTDIYAVSAASGGNVPFECGAPVTAKGVCWSTIPNPTISDPHTHDGTGPGPFTSSISGLIPSTTYCVRAYATNSYGTAYGNLVSFTTLNGLPTCTTAVITNITSNSATGGGEVTSEGGTVVTGRGVCWNTSPNPTLSNTHTHDGGGPGSFTSQLTGLSLSTTYYVKAYATTSFGTTYGNQVSFTTLSGIPNCTTAEITNITPNSATGGGEVTSEGGAPVLEKGVCWNTSPNPSLSNPHTIDGSGPGPFISQLTGLTEFTTYYVCAYATNSYGTYYGGQVCFTTTNMPACNTANISNISQNSATGGGEVTSEGGAPVTEKGVCWSTSQNPTISDPHTNDGSGPGPFISQLTDLNPGTPYYVRAYAINSYGTSYGNQVSFNTTNPCPGIPSIIYEGQTYNTVLVGSQCWLRENLNAGVMIQGPQAQSDNGVKEKYCYDNDPANCTAYGGLYQWSEAMQYSNSPGAQGICPPGWHVPTDADWCTLSTFLDPSVNCSYFGWSGTDAGTKMKSMSGWGSGNGTNSSGLNVLPAGYYDSAFSGVGQYTALWSSSLFSNLPLYRALSSYYPKIYRSSATLSVGYSVRCLKN